MPLMGGANNSNFIPGGNTSSWKGNTAPKGKGQSSWVPSSKNPGKRSGGFKAKSFSSQGNSSSGSYSFGGKSSASGLYSQGTSRIRNSTPTNSYKRPTTSQGTNFNINTRGGSPVAKVVGGAVVAQGFKGGVKAFLSKANPYVAAVLLIADIVLGDRGLEVNDSPEYWISDVGEKQTVSEGGEPPPYGFRISFVSTNNKNRRLTWNVKNYNIVKNPPGSRYTHYIEATFLNDSSGSVNLDPSTLTTSELDYPEGEEPEPISPVQSELNTNHLNIPTPKRATSSNPPPPSIRPPLPSNKTASPTPSKAYDGQPAKPSVVKQATTKAPSGGIESNTSSSSDKNTNQPKINNPLPTPEPLPEPEPPPEKTIEEVEQKQEDSTEVEEPNIISKTKTKRADGTTERTIRREATEEEMKEFDKKLNDIKLRRERVAEILEQDRKFREISVDHPELSENTEFDKFAQEFRDTVDENSYEPFGKVDFYKKSKRSKKNTTNTLPVPEPDATPTPEPLPEPVVQTKVNDNVVEDKIDKLPSVNDIATAVAGLDILRQIKDKPLPSFLCQAPTLVPPVAAQARENNVAIGASQTFLAGQNVVIQNTINGISNVVTNPQYGLQKIQNFAEVAWRATKADKVMAGVSMAMTIHNGMMLSNNLLSTVSEALNMSLNALNIRDETDTPIDIGAAVREKIELILTSLLGAEDYAALTARIAKANRIYQTGINVLDTTYSLFDSARTVAELTAENTGKIGNALRESGAVYEDAYDEFLEEVSPQNASMRRLGRLRDSIDNAEDVFSTINQVASEVVEFKETASQLREEKATLAAEIDKAIATEIEAKEAEKTENTVDTDISDTAFDNSQEIANDN